MASPPEQPRLLQDTGISLGNVSIFLIIIGLLCLSVCIVRSCWYVTPVDHFDMANIGMFVSSVLREGQNLHDVDYEHRRAEFAASNERRRADSAATGVPSGRGILENARRRIDDLFAAIEDDTTAIDVRRQAAEDYERRRAEAAASNGRPISNNERSQADSAGATVVRQRAVAAAIAREVGQQTNNLVDGMSLSDRAAFIKNFLKTDVMTADRLKNMKMVEDVGEKQAIGGCLVDSTSSRSNDQSGTAESFISSIREASGFWPANGDDASQRFSHCAVCLERLRVNEDIGLSQNVDCPHIFHKGCITEWLMAHKDCPICRRSYLDLEAV